MISRLLLTFLLIFLVFSADSLPPMKRGKRLKCSTATICKEWCVELGDVSDEAKLNYLLYIKNIVSNLSKKRHFCCNFYKFLKFCKTRKKNFFSKFLWQKINFFIYFFYCGRPILNKFRMEFFEIFWKSNEIFSRIAEHEISCFFKFSCKFFKFLLIFITKNTLNFWNFQKKFLF